VCCLLCRCRDSRQLYHKQVRHLICAVQLSSFQVQRSRLKASGCYWLHVSIALSLHLNWRNQSARTVASITDNLKVVTPLNSTHSYKWKPHCTSALQNLRGAHAILTKKECKHFLWELRFSQPMCWMF